MAKSSTKYPAEFNVNYPLKLNRATTFFRLILIIPIFIVLILLVDTSFQAGKDYYNFGGVGLVFLAPMAMLLFRKKYPRWWFNWNLELLRFVYRIHSYFFLLRDEYPSTDDPQAITLNVKYPDAKKLNRFLPLVKWILAIPHYIVLIVLTLVAFIFAILSWFAILFTGKYPRTLFNFIVGYLRWSLRVTAYAFVLSTDKYPPFSLKP